jgi:hypothetical protein
MSKEISFVIYPKFLGFYALTLYSIMFSVKTSSKRFKAFSIQIYKN